MGFKGVYCGKEFEGYGNNPDTTWDDKEWKENDRCCDTCSEEIVVPSRIKNMINRKEK